MTLYPAKTSAISSLKAFLRCGTPATGTAGFFHFRRVPGKRGGVQP